MRATRTLHELRRSKECLFACKSYDMKDCLEEAIRRGVAERLVPISYNLMGGFDFRLRIQMTMIWLATCDIYKSKY